MGGPLPPNKYGHRARRIYADLSADRADPSRLFDVFSNAQALIIRQQIEDCVLLVNFFFFVWNLSKDRNEFYDGGTARLRDAALWPVFLFDDSLLLTATLTNCTLAGFSKL